MQVVPHECGLPTGAQSAENGTHDAMLTTVLKGKGAMPPKGGDASVSDAEAKAATDHMLSQVR